MYFADIASSLYFVLENCAGWGARSIMPENMGDANAEKRLSVLAGRRSSDFRARVRQQALKTIAQPPVPLVPVMTSGNRVKFVVKMPALEQGCKTPVCRQEPLLVRRN
jgi:hypothetical protein